jgi:phage repressor protein C with HTH and peptisase S24 domain
MTKKMKKAENYRLVPLINMDVVGGIHSSSEISIYDPQYVVRNIPFVDAREGDICTSVTGTSMVPTCPPGSIVLLREVHNWQEYFGYGEIYCILLTDGRRILKEVQKFDENPKDFILCVSHNKDITPEELPRKMITGVWKVIATLTEAGF